MKQVINVVSWILIAAGGLSFWVGGRALHEFGGVDRLIAEGEGLLAAVVLIGLGAWLGVAAGIPLSKER